MQLRPFFSSGVSALPSGQAQTVRPLPKTADQARCGINQSAYPRPLSPPESGALDSVPRVIGAANPASLQLGQQRLLPALHHPLRFGARVSHTILVNQLDRENGGIELRNQRLRHPDLVALNELRKECLAAMKEAGLDPLPANVYVVPEETFLGMAARNGYIDRYPHWSWGQEYFNLKLPRLYGKKEFFPVVAPNDPVHIYIPDTDPPYAKKVRMLLGLIESDLYRNNIYFRKHKPYDTVAEFATHAESTRQETRQISEQVERVLEGFNAKLARDLRISPEALQEHLASGGGEKPLDKAAAEQVMEKTDLAAQRLGITPQTVRNYLAGRTSAQDIGNVAIEEFLDRVHSVRSLVNASEGIKPLARLGKPSWVAPQPDILGYILMHGKELAPWQRRLIEIIRQESYAQLPKQKTQIVAAGWSAFWNQKLNARNPQLWDPRTVTREALWTAVMFRNNPVKVNNYQLGYVIFKNIEKDLKARYAGDPQRDLKVGAGLRRVRSESYDVSLLRRYLNKAAVRELLLYNYDPKKSGRDSQDTGTKLYISDTDFDQIKERLIEMNQNAGQPLIQLVDADYRGEGGLLLRHVYQYDLKRDYAEQTVMNLAQLWGKSVYLQTYETKDDGSQSPLLLSSNGKSIVSRNVLPEE